MHFLIPKTKILSSALRAAGEKRQGDIKAILLSGGCINTYITFDFNSSSEVTSKTRLSSMRRLFWTLCRHGEAVSLSVGMMPVMATAMKKALTIIQGGELYTVCSGGTNAIMAAALLNRARHSHRQSSLSGRQVCGIPSTTMPNDCLLLRGGRVSRWEGYCWRHRRYLFVPNNICMCAQIVTFL